MVKQFVISLLFTFTFTAVKAQSDSSVQTKEADTIKIGNILIIQKEKKKLIIMDKDSVLIEHAEPDSVPKSCSEKKCHKRSNISTNWWVVDLGFSNVNDQTNYNLAAAQSFFPGGNSSLMRLRNGKSSNINIWVFMQRINILKHVVNFKYGLGIELNNYRYNKNIRYVNEPSDLILRDPEVSNFKKNKLAADYITIPAMINFNFNPKKKNDYGFSAGISAGFLYSSRQKMVSEERGKEKVKSDFNINPWKIAAIGELNLGLLKFYGSYALTTLHRNGLDQTPFSIGLRFNSW